MKLRVQALRGWSRGAVLVGLAGLLNASSAVFAQQVSASLELQAHATVIGQATWFRKGSDLKCGFFRPSKKDESMGSAEVVGGINLSLGPDTPQAVTGQTEVTKGFKGHTFLARRTSASMELVQQAASDRLTVTVTDFLNQQRKTFDNDGRCGHTAGSIRLASDRIHGHLKLTLAPKGSARAVAVSIKRRNGLFRRMAAEGVLHPFAGSQVSDLVVWVKEGESPLLTYEFNEAYGGTSAGASGTVLEIEVRSLGSIVPSLAVLSSTLSALPHRGGGKPPDVAQVVDAIDVLLGAISDAAAINKIIQTTPWGQLFGLTDELFRFEVWPLPGTTEVTRDLKVSARLFGFSLGKALLKDLMNGCEKTSVSWTDGTTLASRRVFVIDGLLALAASVLGEYPTSIVPAEAEAALKRYYANRPHGFDTAVEALDLAVSVSRAATLDRLLADVRAPLVSAVAQEKRIRTDLDASTIPAAVVNPAHLTAAASSRQKAIAALAEVRQVVSIQSRSVDTYSIRLFTTDAHLVRLVVGDVDPYLESVRDAYLKAGELAAEFSQIDECIKSGG